VTEAFRETQEVATNTDHVQEAAAATGAAANQVLTAASNLAVDAQTLSREISEFLHGIRAASRWGKLPEASGDSIASSPRPVTACIRPSLKVVDSIVHDLDSLARVRLRVH
jgi:hypothetical protein